VGGAVARAARVVVVLPAEGGIRDGHVTGVQTCALPILEKAFTWTFPPPRINENSPTLRDDIETQYTNMSEEGKLTSGFSWFCQRSEERRVGKECRSRRWAYLYKRKNMVTTTECGRNEQL